MQLGYDVPLAHVSWFLTLPRDERELFVAVVPRAGVVGWIGVTERPALLASKRADVEGLVVEDEFRGRGTGALLLAAAETWARRRGCTSLHVRTNVVRERAHGFYERAGYARAKSQHVYSKSL